MRRDYLVTPSMIGAKGTVVYTQGHSVASIFDDDHPIHIKEKDCGISKVCIWHVSPLWYLANSNGLSYSLVGEYRDYGKVKSVSKQRITSIVRDTNDAQITITCKGVFKEPVALVFADLDSGAGVVTCWTTETNDEVRFILHPYISCG
jgi:hypothetical protein